MSTARHLAAVEQISSGSRQYDDAFKREVVARLTVQSLSEVSRDTGVARNTLRSWRDAAPVPMTKGADGRVEAALTGSRRQVLEALREKVAALIDDGMSPRDMPANARLLMEIGKEIDAIDARDDEEEKQAMIPDEPFDPDTI